MTFARHVLSIAGDVLTITRGAKVIARDVLTKVTDTKAFGCMLVEESSKPFRETN
jgi:hypothetical protein